ncbi:uncharacterized protein LOC128397911 [Panonychus citri]|uniref:uncharacterized protein LOC128397911 n=1 Tax=Panonychus citri TaxID=50023 RepID=UPI00230726C2|nr:uncharacterized protein LOC128397911 [Panonychus citri]
MSCSKPVDSPIDKLTIIDKKNNQSFKVPKDIACSKSNYFQGACENTKSDDLEILLDIDAVAFQVVMDYLVRDRVSIDFHSVLPTTVAADYLQIDDLLNKCRDFFLKNFTINQLPIVIDSLHVTVPLIFINKQKVDCFIKRHFLKIANTPSFLLFPLKTIEYILELDVIVDSEFRIFEAILRWIEHDNERKTYLSDLSKFIRWSHLSELERNMIKANSLVMEMSAEFEVSMNAVLEKKNNYRISSKSIVEIYEMNDKIKVFFHLNEGNVPLAEFDLCNEISDNVFTNEYTTDIIFDSGRKGIRLDCENKKYKYLNMFGKMDSYYGQVANYIMDYPTNGKRYDNSLLILNASFFTKINTFNFYLKFLFIYIFTFSDVYTKHISENYFHAVTFTLDDGVLSSVAYEIVKNKKVFNDQVNPSEYHVCVIQDIVYLLNKSFTMFQFNLNDKTWKEIKFIDEEGLDFKRLELLNYNDKLCVCDKSSKKVYEYQTFGENWCCVKKIGLEDGTLTLCFYVDGEIFLEDAYEGGQSIRLINWNEPLIKCYFSLRTGLELPIVIDSLHVTVPLIFINKKKVDCFIERHFLKIANTPSFLLFPLKTIEYILELDVIVDSEFRIFEAIIRWIEHDNNRKSHLSDLSKFIRWSHLSELERNMVKTNSLVMEMSVQFEVLINAVLEKESDNRVNSKSLVEIYEMNDTIKVFIYPNENKGPLAEFALCNEISDNVFTNEYTIDIIYDSGRKGIRLDCENKKYKYLNIW